MQSRIHSELALERLRCAALQQQLQATRASLAEVHAELARTRAGESRARHLAAHDALTALPNRSSFLDRLEHAVQRAHSGGHALAVMYLDLDDFKQVNDTHGHDAGDETLRITAARLRRIVRSADVVSRLGGDEFGCLVEGAPDRSTLLNLARKMCDAVAAPMQIASVNLRVRISVGIATFPDDGTTAAGLLARADAAMYRAKRNRSGASFPDPAHAT
jgi:diguanylate cyclase (GGDEF)-like protein